MNKADLLARAWAALGNGDPLEAERLFTALLALPTPDPLARVGLASRRRQQGRLRDAVLLCDAALASDPTCAEAWLERAFVLNTGGSFAAAGDSYRRVLALHPDHAPAHAGLASLAAREGDAAATRHHAATALAHDPGNMIAATALATLYIENGDAAAARDLLAPLAAWAAAPAAEHTHLLTTYGDALARSGDADGAFAAYSEAQGQYAALHEPEGPRETHRDLIERISAEVAAVSPETWALSTPIADPAAAARHVFLLGYPRSGTTLVENVLASLPEVVALEERATLVEADRAFLAQPGGILRLAQLGPADLAPFVSAYWASVRSAGIDPAGRTLVDMDPLKATRLPLIARLFPQARILIMRRDPRDVVLSCFRTNFALTSAALEFTSLERTGRHYDAMMRLIDLARERLPLAFHEVDYHALIRDFDGTTQALCRFLDLPWGEELRRFDRTARSRGVATASASQVRRGLYDGRGQWEPYAAHFEPVMPILQPWIERFGYA